MNLTVRTEVRQKMKQTFIKHRISDAIKINSIVTLHYNEFSKSFVFDGEKHNFWELVYVDKGTAIICAEDKCITLGNGEAVFHKPNEFHAIKADRENPPNVVIITFTTSSPAMSFFEGMNCAVPKELRFHFSEILKNAEKTFVIPMKSRLTLLESPIFGGEQMIKTHLEQLLIELLRISSNNEFSTSREIIENRTVEKCIKFLEENVYGGITVDEVCEAANYSRTYICTLFKGITGKTIVGYYNELKIEEAKKLIRRNEYTFSQISDMLCFGSPTYFSHMFEKITRMTPSEYKASIKE